MKADEKMLEIVQKSTNLEQLAEFLKVEAPRSDNCFNCNQRFNGRCPNFKKTDMSTEALFVAHPDNLKLICAYCATGCGTFEGD